MSVTADGPLNPPSTSTHVKIIFVPATLIYATAAPADPTVSTAARHKEIGEKQAGNIYVEPEIYYVKGGLIEIQP